MMNEAENGNKPETGQGMKAWHWALVCTAVVIALLAVLQIALAFSGKPSKALSEFFIVTRILLAVGVAIPITVFGAIAIVRTITGKYRQREGKCRGLLQFMLTLCAFLMGFLVLGGFAAFLIPQELEKTRQAMGHFLLYTMVAWFLLAILTILVGLVCAVISKD